MVTRDKRVVEAIGEEQVSDHFYKLFLQHYKQKLE